MGSDSGLVNSFFDTYAIGLHMCQFCRAGTGLMTVSMAQAMSYSVQWMGAVQLQYFVSQRKYLSLIRAGNRILIQL